MSLLVADGEVATVDVAVVVGGGGCRRRRIDASEAMVCEPWVSVLAFPPDVTDLPAKFP